MLEDALQTYLKERAAFSPSNYVSRPLRKDFTDGAKLALRAFKPVNRDVQVGDVEDATYRFLGSVDEIQSGHLKAVYSLLSLAEFMKTEGHIDSSSRGSWEGRIKKVANDIATKLLESSLFFRSNDNLESFSYSLGAAIYLINKYDLTD